MSGMAYVDVVFDASARASPAAGRRKSSIDSRASLPLSRRTFASTSVPPRRARAGFSSTRSSTVRTASRPSRCGAPGRRLASGARSQSPAWPRSPRSAAPSQQVLVEAEARRAPRAGPRLHRCRRRARPAFERRRASPRPRVHDLEATPLAGSPGAGRPTHPRRAVAQVRDHRGDADRPRGLRVASPGGRRRRHRAPRRQPPARHRRRPAHPPRGSAPGFRRASISSPSTTAPSSPTAPSTRCLSRLAEEVAVVVLVVLVFLLHGRSALVPLADAAARPPADVRGDVAAPRPGDDHEPRRDRHRARNGGRRRRRRARGLPPSPRGDRPDARAPRRRRRRSSPPPASFAPAILTSLSITALSFLPVFAFTGETGRLLRPLALTKTLVIASAAIVTLTARPRPARSSARRAASRPELDNPLTRGLVALYRPFVHFALARPRAHAHRRRRWPSCRACRSRRRSAASSCPRIDEGDLLFMPTTLPGVPPEQAAAAARAAGSGHRGVRRGRHRVRQSRARRHGDRSGAVLDGRDDDAAPAALALAERTVARTALVLRAGRRRAWLRRVLGLVWPEESRADTTAELVDRLDRATRLPGWTNAWTRAGARTDGHDVDRRADTGRHPHRRRRAAARSRPSAARCARSRSRVPGTRERGVRVARAARRGSTSSPDADAIARTSVDAGRSCRSTADAARHRRAARRDRARRAPAPRSRSSPTSTSERGPADLSSRDVHRPRRRPATRGSRFRSRCSGAPPSSRGPRWSAPSAASSCAYVYVDLDPGADLAGYVERAQREVDAAIARERAPPAVRASASSGPASTSSSPRARGACAGSPRSSRSRCSASCSSSSAA